jgi:hypothetical protein
MVWHSCAATAAAAGGDGGSGAAGASAAPGATSTTAAAAGGSAPARTLSIPSLLLSEQPHACFRIRALRCSNECLVAAESTKCFIVMGVAAHSHNLHRAAAAVPVVPVDPVFVPTTKTVIPVQHQVRFLMQAALQVTVNMLQELSAALDDGSLHDGGMAHASPSQSAELERWPQASHMLMALWCAGEDGPPECFGQFDR